jgi:prepilin-type N-terminal cleavage/methylation domain-containing protein
MTGRGSLSPVDPRGDEGFTLIELMTAVGIFSVLMVIVGATTLSGFSAIREATSRSSIQRARSMMRDSRVASAPIIAATAVSINTGATAAWMP